MPYTGSVPEKIARNRVPIPNRPSQQDVRGIVGEISRHRSVDRETEILLQHMVQVIFDRFNDIWDALEILDKRFQEFEDDDLFDSIYREVGRETSRRERTVESRDGNVQVDLLDVISQVIRMRGNNTGRQIEFRFDEPMPV